MKYFSLLGLSFAFLLFFSTPSFAEVPVSFFPDPEKKISDELGKKLAQTTSEYFSLNSPETPYMKVKLKLLTSEEKDHYMLNVYLFHKAKYYCEIHTLKVDENFQVVQSIRNRTEKKEN